MLRQRFEDYRLTGGIAAEKAADRGKAEAKVRQAQQQYEDQKTTQKIVGLLGPAQTFTNIYSGRRKYRI